MNLHSQCIICQLEGEMKRARAIPLEKDRIAFLKEACAILSRADERYAISSVFSQVADLHRRYHLPQPDYEALKALYNQKMLDLLPALRHQMEQSADPLYCALAISRAGNYIDFGAFDSIDDDKLLSSIHKAQEEPLDEKEYAHLKRELAAARRLCYVVDNCGEIVLDMLVLEAVKGAYPQVEITILTRGAPVLNDATREDALSVGMDRYGRLMDNGTDLAGTQIELISPQARQLLEKSDVIIAKGMGNFETMCGCGLNVYYLFLCKCSFFAGRLKVPMMTGMLLNDRRMGEDVL